MKKASGIHFYNSRKILLGKKAYGKLKGLWSGFGGSVESGESVSHAAVREVLEELYGFENLAPRVVKNIGSGIDLKIVYKNENYTLFSGGFDDLKKINQKISSLFNNIPFFGPRIPISLEGLCRKFDSSVSRNPEFHEIGVFTFSEILANPKKFDPSVIEDIEQILSFPIQE